MHVASLARLSCALVAMTLLVVPQASLAETMSLDIVQPEWQRGQLLPAFCDIPLVLGSNVASITGVTLQVTGVPKEGLMTLCKGGCDEFPCHQTLHAYFLDDHDINSWTPLEGPDEGYDFTVAMMFADCYPDCYHPCTGKDVAPEDWNFLKDGGSATLRLELMGDFAGCGTTCRAEMGIARINVTVDYEPLIHGDPVMWGSMKAVYR